MGKGSGRRPMAITQEELRDNWDRIFNKEKANGNKSDTANAKKNEAKRRVSSRSGGRTVE